MGMMSCFAVSESIVSDDAESVSDFVERSRQRLMWRVLSHRSQIVALLKMFFFAVQISCRGVTATLKEVLDLKIAK